MPGSVIGDDTEEDVDDDSRECELYCMMAEAKHRTTKIKNNRYEGARYDTDSFLIVVDSGCSYCITNDATHFVGTPEKINKSVKESEGTSQLP